MKRIFLQICVSWLRKNGKFLHQISRDFPNSFAKRTSGVPKIYGSKKFTDRSNVLLRKPEKGVIFFNIFLHRFEMLSAKLETAI